MGWRPGPARPLAISGCTSSGQMIAEVTIAERIALLRVGESTKSDVERILGPDHSTERNRWSSNFSDTVYEVAERRFGPAPAILLVNAGGVPTNTRPWL